MLNLYLASLGVGGTLLLASFLLGGSHDADHDIDHDIDHDVDHDIGHVDADIDLDTDIDHDVDGDADAGHDVDALDAVLGWLPVTSLRFWTFFTAFFGLTGALMTLTGAIESKTVVGAVAGAVGWASGASVVRIIRRLRKTEASSSVSESDYIGATGVVMVRVEKGEPGKIRLQLKGRAVELIANTEEDEVFEPRKNVVVLSVEDGVAMVAKEDRLQA